ncbi:hypothetical protein VaNZ11_011630, partial [Volvox africanus]
LAESGVPKKWWHEALYTASYLRNRSPSLGKPKTPFELFTGSVPDVSHLRVFGCVVYIHVPKGQGDKLDPRARKGTLLGYEPNSKAYHVLLEDDGFPAEKAEASEPLWFDVIPSADDVSAAVVPGTSQAAGASVEAAGMAGQSAAGDAPNVPTAGAPAGDAGEAGTVVRTLHPWSIRRTRRKKKRVMGRMTFPPMVMMMMMMGAEQSIWALPLVRDPDLALVQVWDSHEIGGHLHK